MLLLFRSKATRHEKGGINLTQHRGPRGIGCASTIKVVGGGAHISTMRMTRMIMKNTTAILMIPAMAMTIMMMVRMMMVTTTTTMMMMMMIMMTTTMIMMMMTTTTTMVAIV